MLCLTDRADAFNITRGKGEVIALALGQYWPTKGSPLTPKDKLVVKFTSTRLPIAKKIANFEYVTIKVGCAREGD